MFVEFDQVEPANRYSAERTSHQVNFSCFAPTAKLVSVAGQGGPYGLLNEEQEIAATRRVPL
jgi:1,4-alpha-glucan branching enzyme